ncbi:DUF6383 domain-containing protein [Parabacteroides merdae]|uniref:DUF6383 domain-containing protein n=1 Tax=Parabacteroides merdae TaxID=46503 RepID=UPI0035618018
MNKKFSTLLAGVALFGATSAFAGNNVPSLIEGTNDGLYQLKTPGNLYLAVNAKGELVTVDNVTADNVASTLWCTTVTVENQGKAPIYDFVNKGAEALLSVTMDDFAKNAMQTTKNSLVGGEIAGWAFSGTYANALEANRPLYSYFQEDSVVGLVLEGTNVRLKKAGGKAADISGAKFATFTLVEADGIALNTKQINTKLGIQDAANGVKLTFNPDRNNTSLENPFSDVAFIAKDARDGSFVYVTRKADNQYLHVDTAYTNKNSDKFLAFNYKTALSTDLADQGKFLFTYFPSHDSLVIQVKQATRLSASVKDWKKALTTAGNKTIIANNKTAKNYVTIQDLVKADEIRIVTIADVKETDITLGFTGCVQAGTDKVSLEDGLYVIQNAETNKYLASPIHVDGAASEWVTVDKAEQNVMHMPAYQWVVLKTKTSEYFLSTSPVNVTNREYPSLKNPTYNTTDKVLKNGASWQLTQAEGSKLYYCKALSSDSLVITKITDKNILGDKYLGYKYLTDDELMITNYAFNYFNPYTMDKYIAQVEGDTTLNALQEEATFFELVKQNNNKTVAYGYTVDATVQARIEGLAQLERATYQIKAGKNMIAVGKENRYVLTENLAPATFYFKENNETEKGCYYAFIDADDVNKDNKGNVLSFNNKLGVADQSLKALLQEQVIEEVRTSAFRIGLADQPLYRRFNHVELDGAVEGNEDATKLLKFKEAYVGDYLMDETNKNFMREDMDYLGIGAKNIAKAGLSFNVRPFNIGKSTQYQIKPQYLVYVSETENKGTEGKPCDATNHKHMNANGEPCGPEDCIHATPAVPGFNRYKLLVSFADSVEAKDVVKGEELYHFGKYHRVGFVDAVEQDSVLYILGEHFENVATKDLSMEDIKKVVKGINLKVAVTEDTHHNYTWSFRYIDPAKAANEVEEDRAFLIESNVEPKGNKGESIAPTNAAWLKNQNNCLVLSDPEESEFEEAKTGGDNALIFNIEKGSADDMATDNEEIATSEVTVIAGEGNVTIAGAAGKKVVVSNILGQVVANTVITSDNATIAAPAGVVVVAVEGEEAVKAIIK